VDFIIDNPLQSLTTNIRGTEIILELANEKKKKGSSLFCMGKVGFYLVFCLNRFLVFIL
jgi:dTDP-D-glucose 4,6-dehydratase